MSATEAINSLVTAFTKFVFRDVVFILGGAIVLGSVLYIYGKLPVHNPPILVSVGLAGLSYVIGYTLQDGLTLLRLVRTKAAVSPCKLAQCLYKMFERQDVEYEKVETDEYENAMRWLYRTAPERFRADHERIESLKQVGTVLGPCFIVAGVLLLLKRQISSSISFHALLAIGGIAMGIVLWCLGLVKVTQQAQHLLKRSALAKREDQGG